MYLILILRILSALLALFIFSECIEEFRSTNINYLTVIFQLLCISSLGYFSFFGKWSIFKTSKSNETHSFELSDEILDFVDKAISNAHNLRHGVATTEHLLYELLKNSESASIINGCGGNLDNIRQTLDSYFENVSLNLKVDVHSEKKISKEFKHTLERSTALGISSYLNSDEFTAGYLLASLLEITDTFSYKVLRENKICRFDVLKQITKNEIEIHGYTEIENIPTHYAHGMWKIIIYNDNFSTMEFVCSLLTNVFLKSKENATETMLSIHYNDYAICGEYEYSEAVEKLNKVHELARKSEFPLMCSISNEKI